MTKKESNVLYLVLALQLAASFLLPPIAIGNRSLFLGDVFCLGWAVYFSFKHWSKFSKNLKRLALASAASIALAYLSSVWRPQVVIPWNDGITFVTGPVEWLREFVIAARFLSWIWAAIVSWHFFSTQVSLQRRLPDLLRVLFAITVVVFVLMILERVEPFRGWIGSFYNINYDYRYWRGRVNGPLRSPVETGMVVSLCGLVLYLYRRVLFKKKSIYHYWGAFVALASLALTHTITPLTGLAFTFWLWVLLRSKATLKWVWGLCVPLALFGTLYALESHSHFIYQKHLDFVNRFVIWKFHLIALTASPRAFLLGLGFYQFHCDNSFLFILTRTGFLGLSIVLYALLRVYKTFWKLRATNMLLLLSFCVICALTLDFWIYRAFIGVFLSVFVPICAVQASTKRAIV